MKKIFFICMAMVVNHIAFGQWTTVGSDMYNSNSGKVGVGTSTPSTKFSIKSDSYYPNAGFSILSGFSSNIMYLNCTGGTADITATNLTGLNLPNLYFHTGINQTTIIRADGNVGIGTSLANNPNGYKLGVKGRIGAHEVQVENTSSAWADYVFEPTYKLMPILEVESFINTNKHLPEVPSALEVNENGGHNLGEMDVLLLKKVEELTLYLIDQGKQIENLKKENEEQRRQIESLSKSK
jgi:hypothetical protein